MNNIKRLLCILTAVLFAAFALSAVAGNDKKQVSLHVVNALNPEPADPPYTLTATVTNEGNSTVNSFQIFSDGLTILDVSQPPSGNATTDGLSISVKNMHPLKSGQSVTLTIHVGNAGNGNWSVVAWTGSSLNGQTFNLDFANSSLNTPFASANAAAGGEDFTALDVLNPECVTGMRGYYDKDGSHPTGTLPIYVWNTVPINNQLHFEWPDFQVGGDPLATFEYTVCAPGNSVPPPGSTQVAWLNTDGNPASAPGTPAYIAAQDCLDPDVLPAPYGTFKGFTTYDGVSGPSGFVPYIGSGDMYMAINTANPPRQSPAGTPPGSIDYPGNPPADPSTPGTQFYVVIDAERISVQLVCLDNESDAGDAADCTETGEREYEGTALKVLARGVGGTAVTTHSSGAALVMSTPLPLLPANVPAPYVAGNQALMCVAEQFIEYNGAEPPQPIGHATTFIDIGGDGWGSHP